MKYAFSFLRSPLTVLLGIAGFAIALAGCDLLDVDNPNSLIEDDLRNPTAAPAIANGALGTVTGAVGSVLVPYSTATDELTWTGTRDAWEQLAFGEVTNPLNEFADGAFQSAAEARWTADEAIRRLNDFRDEGSLRSIEPLIRSYVYGGIIYVTIADVYDDFVFSDRREAAPPVGSENMNQVYRTAIEYLDEAIALARNAGNAEWENRALAVRARAYHALGLWQKVNPVDVSAPLVASAEAATDARAVLQQVSSDWRFDLAVEPGTPSNSMASQVNNRRELRISDTYVVPSSEGNRVESIRLTDPIDEIAAPRLKAEIEAFVSGDQYVDITVASAREMHLILAEDALARGQSADFRGHINNLRSLDGLTEYDGQISEQDLLKHSRQVNLFLQGRRLADHYRFDDPAPQWNASNTPGDFFPITITEIRSNPHISFGQ